MAMFVWSFWKSIEFCTKPRHMWVNLVKICQSIHELYVMFLVSDRQTDSTHNKRWRNFHILPNFFVGSITESCICYTKIHGHSLHFERRRSLSFYEDTALNNFDLVSKLMKSLLTTSNPMFTGLVRCTSYIRTLCLRIISWLVLKLSWKMSRLL